jgi:glyoxylase-like metal-dependent hydrolase (beta-lactamase superfamily II)
MRRTLPLFRLLPLLALFALAAPGLASSQNFDAVEIQTQMVRSGVYMLQGSGGNIGVFVGEDGVFVIDDQYAPLTDKILAAIAEISSEPVRFVFNTHWHGDHTGGNENLGRAGAVIVAHENVRERLSMDQVLERIGREPAPTPAAPAGALPVITFAEDVTFHLNGDELYAFHVSNAHTDGDAIVHFRGANVVHMGDTFFRDRFPFIDTATGGSIDGLIAATGAALAVMNARTMVIPGHGALSTREDLRAYRDALMSMRDAVATLVEEGHPPEHIHEFRPIADQAAAWGQDEAAEQNFVETILYGLEH